MSEAIRRRKKIFFTLCNFTHEKNPRKKIFFTLCNFTLEKNPMKKIFFTPEKKSEKKTPNTKNPMKKNAILQNNAKYFIFKKNRY